jgi:hypothetical protein
MGVELLIEPGRSTFMDSDTQKIGSRTVRIGAVTVVAINVVTVTVMAITVGPVSIVTVPRFEWPTPTHATVFFIPDLKSKPEM